MSKNRRVRSALVGAAALALTLTLNPSHASAGGGDYPPSPTTVPERSLDVSAFAPVCQNDVPYIDFEILPVGFGSTGPATLRIFDINGTFVEEHIVSSLSGRILYPGASTDSQGNGTDWPGWAFVDGEWVIDTSDAILRDGLSIEVEVNPTATATVGYPPATEACNGPEDPEDPEDPDDPAEETETSGVLPSTGSNATMIILLIGTGMLGAGIITSVAMRRRHAGADATPNS